MDKAVEIGERLLEVLPPAQGNELVDVLSRGMRQALELEVATVGMVRAQLDASGAEVDLKLLRLGVDTANNVFKSGMRLLEHEFQTRKLDKLGEVLQAIAGAAKPEE